MAEPRADHRRGEVAVDGVRAGGEHEFGRDRVDRRNVLGEGFKGDAPGAQAQGRARGEERGTQAPGVAARDEKLPEGALVRKARALLTDVAEFVEAGDGEGRQRHAHVELAQDHLTRGVGAFVQIETRLDGEKRHRRVGAAARDRADPVAGRGVEAGRDVERELLRAAFVEPKDGVEVGARDGLLLTGAEETVDHDRGGFGHVGVFRNRAARGAPLLHHAAAEVALRGAGHHELDRDAFAAKCERRADGVAPVVAGAGEDRHALALIDFSADPRRGGLTRTAHEHVVAQKVRHAVFEKLEFVVVEDREAREAHGSGPGESNFGTQHCRPRVGRPSRSGPPSPSIRPVHSLRRSV